MLNDVLDDIRSQKNFYRDQYRRFLKALMVCLAMIFILIFLILLIVLSRAEPDFYASNIDGMVQRVYPAPWNSHLKPPAQDAIPVQPKAQIQ